MLSKINFYCTSCKTDQSLSMELEAMQKTLMDASNCIECLSCKKFLNAMQLLISGDMAIVGEPYEG